MFVMGGMGARAGMDGLHTMSFPANSSNIPVEVLESVAPVRVRRKHLRADSGGAGRYRGGCGQVFEFESVSSRPIVARAEHGKLDTAPRGLRGGGEGLGGGNSVNGAAVADKLPVVLRDGDVMTLEIPGSGGLGPARERDRAAVARDVADGIVTPEAALADYGVEVDVEAGG